MRKPLRLLPIFWLCLVSVSFASDPIGIYALIDKVVLEPSEGNPQRIQIYGAFSTAVKGFGDEYTPPARGYLYYQLPEKKADVAKAEWTDMQKVAGTGQIIAFASRYQPQGRIRSGASPSSVRDVDEKQIAALLLKLDDQEQPKRDAASDELRRIAKGAEPQLRKAAESASPEVRGRIERVLADLEPDLYPIGFGLVRVRGDGDTSTHIKALRTFPSNHSPANGDLVEAGTVRLVAGNIAESGSRYEYKFDIESSDGQQQSSSAIQQGQKQTEWRPQLQIKPGVKYTWRVWVETAAGRGPVATATFRGQ